MQMGSQLKDLLKTPERGWYDGKITRHDHFSDLRDIDVALDRVPEEFKVEDRHRCTESCFGHFLRMDWGMKFSASIAHQLLLRELHHDGPEDEMRFMIGPHLVRLSKVEFCQIIGLKFGVIPDTTRYEMVQYGIHQRYFGSVAKVDSKQLRSVLRIGIFEQQYDSVKLCLIYMLNWILIGLDKREKVPLWQIRIVEDLDAFDAFPWGAHMYRQSIFGFKHALDGRCERTYARTELVPTVAERVARYYEDIEEGGSLYTAADRHKGSIPNPSDDTTAGPSHTESSDPEFIGECPPRHWPGTEASEPEFVYGSPLRCKQVRLTMPGEVHSREDVGGHRQDCLEHKIQYVMDAVAALRRISGKVMRNGICSIRRDRDGRRSHDRGTDPPIGLVKQGDRPQTQSLRAGDIVREQQMQVPGATDT
ncbi:hypothetical protein Dsin_002791 [Dipteronia sinensis]|uniref:DUF1985 domain-containing protein n=1 Tax=Dipteronia sinensis TaxID=43782 RepID=A0AAE0B7R9_9ROSI|nr:hypothetical protein Dsin_002791 [Dipteronia sinensis]